MFEIANLAAEDREFIFILTGNKMGIHKSLVEKDFWICFVLNYLFTRSKYKDNLVFKGGTSLSKGFNIIERFSEDIDLILDWTVLGVDSDEPVRERSHTKQDEFNKKLNCDAAQFIKEKLLVDIKENLVSKLNDEVLVEIDEKNNQSINFYYPQNKEFGVLKYIKPFISLEIGQLAAWHPSKKIKITPYIYEAVPEIFNQNLTKKSNFEVLTVLPERTFWEKATILHKEANRPLERAMPHRYSRHYYDLYCFIKTEYAQKALKDKSLLQNVVAFKNKFYRDGWSNYDDCLCGKFKLIPPNERIPELKRDYVAMREMLYGKIPLFDEIIIALRDLEKTINNL